MTASSGRKHRGEARPWQGAYSIREVFADIQDLHASCSLAGALAAMENAVEKLDLKQSIDEANAVAQKTMDLKSTLKKAADVNK